MHCKEFDSLSRHSKITVRGPSRKLSSQALGDGAIVSASMRRSFHLRRVPRFSASVSRYRLPDTSRHAYHHHRLGAASRSQVACLRQVVKARPGVVFQPGHLQGGPPRCAASPHFRTQNGPPERCSKFLPLRGADKMALAAQETFLTGRRARKSGWKSVLAQNRRGSSR